MKIHELQERQTRGENLLLLDIREPAELSEIPMMENAHHMPMGKVFTEAAQGHLPKDKKIVTICKTGGRCEIVARELSEKGYDIDVLEGGMQAWEDNRTSSA